MDFNIYLIGDKNLFEDEESYLKALDESFAGGIGAFQLRQKDIGIGDFIKLGERIKKIIEKYKTVKFFVNDRVDVSLALEADGVHLNKNSISVKAVKDKIKNLKVIYSSHSLDEALKAQDDGADAVTFSPVFKTKNQNFEWGAVALGKVVDSMKIPVFALGGINQTNIDKIKEAGAKYVAVQSGILKEKDITKAVEFLSKSLS